MNKIEKRIVEYIEKNITLVAFIIILILSIVIRILFINVETNDYVSFLRPWFDYFKANGGLLALNNYPGDYNAPYMIIIALLSYIPINSLYLIKIVSIIFDYILAFSCVNLFRTINKNKNILFESILFIIISLLPTVILNSSMWCQCDSIYASFAILGIASLIKEEYLISFVFFGVSLAFKLQCIFILPIYIIIYFSKKKFPFYYFFIIPLINIILSLPALAAGNSIKNIMLVYFNQVKEYADSLVYNYPNIYNLIPSNVENFRIAGIVFSLIICVVIFTYVLYKKIKFTPEKILALSTWFIIVLTYSLPSMHDRYMFLGEILTIVYCFIYHKNYKIAIITNINGLIVYLNYLTSFSFNYMDLLSLVYLIIIIDYTKNIYKLFEKNKRIA